MSRKMILAVLLAVVFPLGMALGQGVAGTFTPIDFPAPGSNSTFVNGINAWGDLVGTYNDANGAQHGFARIDGQFKTIDYPGTADHPAWVTTLWAINNKGEIAGTVQFDPAKPGADYHGFVLRRDDFESVQFPGHLNTITAGINDSGEVVGCYHDYNFSTTMHGFLFTHGHYTAIDGNSPPLPDKPNSMNNGVTPDGGLIVGLWTDTAGVTHSYSLEPHDGDFKPFDYPDSIHTEAWGINPSREIVGFYADQSSNYHGFVMHRGHFDSVDFPGAMATFAVAINPQGAVAGGYLDAAGNQHGFVFVRSPRIG